MDNRSPAGEVYRSFFSVARQLKRLAHQSAAEIGLTVHQVEILRQIVNSPGLSQKEVTERLRVPKSRVSLHIDALTEKELVIREVSPEDRRETLLSPTPAGTDLCAKYSREDAAHRALDGALASFTHTEITEMLNMHDRLLRALSE